MATGPEVMIAFDDLTDVVSAYVADTRPVRYGPAPTDAHMMIERDALGAVVGVEIAGASAMRPSFWRQHPDRCIIPAAILAELDEWLAHRWGNLGRSACG